MLQGPFDHDVPVLLVRDLEQTPRAIVFGYACHATVLSFHQWSGDYPGFAQQEIEQNHPGCVAMFWAGCGADQNPLPRRSVDLAKHYGRRLAVAVEDVMLTRKLKPVEPSLQCATTTLRLDFAKLPSAKQLELDMNSKDQFVAARAKLLREKWDRDGKLTSSYDYPLTRWSLGDVEWLFMGGEVVVDYAIRIKREATGQNTWVGCLCERRHGIYSVGASITRRSL